MPKSTREDFRPGDKVAFEEKHMRTAVGTVMRVNACPATITGSLRG